MWPSVYKSVKFCGYWACISQSINMPAQIIWGVVLIQFSEHFDEKYRYYRKIRKPVNCSSAVLSGWQFED